MGTPPEAKQGGSNNGLLTDDDLTGFLRDAAIVGGSISALGVVLSWWFGAQVAAQHQDWTRSIAALDSLRSLCINLTAASIIYLVAHYSYIRKIDDAKRESQQKKLLDRFQEAFKEDLKALNATLAQSQELLREELKGLAILGILEHQDIDRVEWGPKIVRAKKIDICVQGWYTWVAGRKTYWKEFFKNGGTLNLILPNPDITDAMRFMEERLGRKPGKQKDDIEQMRDLLVELCKGTNGSIKHFRVNQMIWYCAVRFDDKDLFLSLYEHIRFENSDIESPTYQVFLAKHEHTKDWMEKEFKGLMKPENLCAPVAADEDRSVTTV
jgi:hypothetical protein